MRFFASVTNGRKNGKNNGMVNTNAYKPTQGGDEPPLTIYPFSIKELKKPQTKTKFTNKTQEVIGTKSKTTPIVACKLPERIVRSGESTTNDRSDKPTETGLRNEAIVKVIIHN